MLWKYKYYYISIDANYGLPTDYISDEIRKLIDGEKSPFLTELEEKILKIMDENIGYYTGVNFSGVLDNLWWWPEVGFYENINMKKYLIGIVIPKKYVENSQLKLIIKSLHIRIFVCDNSVITEVNHI